LAACLTLLPYTTLFRSLSSLIRLLPVVVLRQASITAPSRRCAHSAFRGLRPTPVLPLGHSSTGTASNSTRRSASSAEALISSGSPCTNNSAMNETPNQSLQPTADWRENLHMTTTTSNDKIAGGAVAFACAHAQLGLKMFFHRSLPLAVSMFAAVPLLALALSPPWESGRRRGELFVAGSATDAALRTRIAALSPTVSPNDARRVAYTAYMTGLELRREWRVVGQPGLQNLLVNMGARKGGLCFQWATELLVRLDALRLQTLELHWAESFANTSGEHNVIVVTARGQAFEEGILLDN